MMISRRIGCDLRQWLSRYLTYLFKIQPDLEPVWKKDVGKLVYFDKFIKMCKLMKDMLKALRLFWLNKQRNNSEQDRGRERERLRGPRKHIHNIIMTMKILTDAFLIGMLLFKKRIWQ